MRLKHILLSFSITFVALVSMAQEIQTLPADPAITSGTLPNGLRYYVAVDPSLKGMADFALVQRTGTGNIPGVESWKIMDVSQESLAPCFHLGSRSVQEFFMDQGVLPGRKGFVEVTEDATIFRFGNMMLNQSASVMDSTLLVLMDMVGKTVLSDPLSVRKLYAPSDQALIVAGDVNAKQVVEKMRMLSFMIPASESVPRQEYVWKDKDEMEVVFSPSVLEKICELSATWRLQRTPKEFMNTVQPAIYERYMTEAGIIAEERIRKCLDEMDIPYADVSSDYVNSMGTSGDESFRVSLAVGDENAAHALSVLASVMSALDSSDVRIEEIHRAEHLFLERFLPDSEKENNRWLDKCISAFLYNSSLASKSALLTFHRSRNIADNVQLAIFNSILTSSIDSRRNLLLECRTSSCGNLSESQIREIFESSWKKGMRKGVEETLSVSDPVLPVPGEPVKVKSLKKEHMSGGVVMTMANGFKVVYRKMSTENVIHYSLVLNGGYASVPSLRKGEGAYMSDILKFSIVGGADSEEFHDFLRRSRITMDMKSGLSSLSLNGKVKSDKLELLVRTLVALLNDRKTDKEEFARYLKREPLRLEYMKVGSQARMSAIDHIMCPDYIYSPFRSSGTLTADFVASADAFMESHASKADDGMLVLVGDIDEKALKNVMQTYAGKFRTQGRTFSRPVVRYQPNSGKMLYTVDGEEDSMDVAMTVQMALTAENYYASAVAAMALRKELAHAVTGTGMWLDLQHNCRKYPQERFNLMISLNEASVDGFAPGTATRNPMEALVAVRNVLDDPGSVKISDKELASYKALLKKYVEIRKKNPEYWLKAISIRYLDGKDFTTGSDARIDAISREKVMSILSSLKDGARVEYITNRK